MDLGCICRLKKQRQSNCKMRSLIYGIALVTSTVLVVARPTLASETLVAAKSNIVFIFVDDQGYYDLGCYGAAEVKTPRIDAMANEGIRFTDYYAAAPICSPSRAGLLTGLLPATCWKPYLGASCR